MDSPAPPGAQPAPAADNPSGTRGRSLLGRRLLAVLAVSAIAAVAIVVIARARKDKPPAVDDSFPLPPLSSSPFLNTKAEARYVGSESCRGCHGGRDGSFRRTGMGRSMAEIDLEREPPDAAFDHVPSKRRYQVARKDGRMWHRELLLTAEPDEVVLSEHPVKYVVGSGRHSLTYLVEVDGFLVESPVTWYRSRNKGGPGWGMSPGYDVPQQEGFQRAVSEHCLICHAGQAAALGGTAHKMRVSEAAIGCERCHGPGSLHIARHQGRQREAGAAETTADQADYTIVNPARLSRNLAEAVCQQCHLRPTAVVLARGRAGGDFRPGLPLQDVRHPYMLHVPEAPMTVTGHVEQMHLSRCYQKSDTLSCLTCHNPHNEPHEQQRTAYYQAICLKCHEAERCTVPVARRAKESPANDCVQCHMPRSPTEIPHLAFTHHRIGVHDKRPDAAKGDDPVPQAGGELRPFLELSRVSEIDRKRSLGLAYLEASQRAKGVVAMARFRQRALDLLSEVRTAGLRDSLVEVALARLHDELGQPGVLTHAQNALAHAELTGQERCNALFLVADQHALGKRPGDAVAALRELSELRRHPADWLLRADCENALGNRAAAEKALLTAVQIDPRLWKVHRHLADQFQQRGDTERAAWHRRRAVP